MELLSKSLSELRLPFGFNCWGAMQDKINWKAHVGRLASRRLRFAAWTSLCACLIHHFDQPVIEILIGTHFFEPKPLLLEQDVREGKLVDEKEVVVVEMVD